MTIRACVFIAGMYVAIIPKTIEGCENDMMVIVHMLRRKSRNLQMIESFVFKRFFSCAVHPEDPQRLFTRLNITAYLRDWNIDE